MPAASWLQNLDYAAVVVVEVPPALGFVVGAPAVRATLDGTPNVRPTLKGEPETGDGG